VASRTRAQEVDLPPDRSPRPATDRSRGPCAHPPPGPREPALGLRADRGRSPQARPPRGSDDDPDPAPDGAARSCPAAQRPNLDLSSSGLRRTGSSPATSSPSRPPGSGRSLSVCSGALLGLASEPDRCRRQRSAGVDWPSRRPSSHPFPPSNRSLIANCGSVRSTGTMRRRSRNRSTRSQVVSEANRQARSATLNCTATLTSWSSPGRGQRCPGVATLGLSGAALTSRCGRVSSSSSSSTWR